jgi:hypothetical protein
MTVSLGVLLDLTVVFQGLVISVILYLVRLVFLFVLRQKPMSPLLYIAPRGLITVLLFFAIESQYSDLVFQGFDQGVLLVVILTTALVMTAALIQHGDGIQPVAELDPEALVDGGELTLASPDAPVTDAGNDGPEAEESNPETPA